MSAAASESLASQLSVIEARPLAERAEAYQEIHEQLSRTLERTPE